MDTLYYGNTIFEWAQALLLIVGSIVLARFIYWVFKTWLKLLVRRTAISIDDLLIDNAEEPVVLMIILTGIRWSLNTLTLSKPVQVFLDTAALFLTVISVTWLIARFYDTIHNTYIAPIASKTGTNLDDQLLPVIRTGIRSAIWTLGIIIALNNAGYNVGAILAGLGIGGIAFALAAQDTISNIFGGLTILLQHPFQIEDIIIFEDRWLVVDQIGLRASRLIDFNTNHIVIIPNSKFTSSVITNVSKDPSHVADLEIFLSATTTAAQLDLALSLLDRIAVENADTEPILTRVDRFEKGAIVLLYVYKVKDFRVRHRVMTDIGRTIVRAFEYKGIKMAVPTAVRVSRDLETGIFG